MERLSKEKNFEYAHLSGVRWVEGASSSAQLFKKNAGITSNLLKTAFKNPGKLKNVVATNVPIIFKELMKNNKKILIKKIFPEVMTSGVKLV